MGTDGFGDKHDDDAFDAEDLEHAWRRAREARRAQVGRLRPKPEEGSSAAST